MIKDNANIKTVQENLSKTEDTLQIRRLRESEEKYRTLFETMVLGVVYQDINGKIISANRAAEEILGLSIEQMTGRTSTDPRWKSIHEDESSFPGETHPAMIALKTGKRVNNVVMGVFYPKKEEIRWININATPLYKNGEKKPYQVYTTFEDITERKRVEESLRESEERLRLAQTRGNVGVWDWNTITDEVHFTPELEQLYGLTPGKIKTYQDWRQLAHPEDIEKIEVERDNKIAKNEPFDLELRIFHNSGEIHWLSAKGGAIYDNQGNVLRVLGVNTDITDRKQAELLTQKLLESEKQLTEELTTSNEELMHQGDRLLQINKALEESEERFHDLADNIPNLAWMADATGWIFWYNTQWFDYTGTTLEEMQGWGWQKVHHPDYVESITEEWSSNIRAGKPYGNIFPLKGKDGNYRWFLTRITPIRDEQGKLLRWFGTNTDITELKQSEEELKRSNIELERFAYVSSHDLQEPLRMVTLYSQLLERRYKDNLDNDANDFIEYIVEGANRMRQLIYDLLEYSRVKSQAKEFEKVDLEKVLHAVLHNLTIPIEENNVTISHDSLPTVFADKNQMVQVFQNLITNAIKFHGQNTPDIYISAQKHDQEWKFAVKDKGIGIDPKHQKQIFEVFKRLHTREEYLGTGIGLSITQKIIIHHGGQIWVESELGKGSTFYFTIPIK